MKKKSNWFLRILFMFFVIFVMSYIVTRSGYYEAKLRNKTTLTDQKIKQFEDDVKEGKSISLDSYYTEEKPDYSSLLSNTGKKLSNNLSKSIIGFFTQFGKIVKKLFW